MTPFESAQRYIGVKEFAGGKDHPFIVWCLMSCGFTQESHDEVPWCSAFVNRIAWEWRLPRSYSARARSWLKVGKAIGLTDARPDSDIVVLRGGSGVGDAGPDVLNAPGHVGFFAGLEGGRVRVLGGNQGDAVSIATFPLEAVLGVRRLT